MGNNKNKFIELYQLKQQVMGQYGLVQSKQQFIELFSIYRAISLRIAEIFTEITNIYGNNKTHIFRNAYIFSSKLASTIYQGFNVPHLKLHLFITKIKYHHAPNNAIAVSIAGLIKGHISTRKNLCLPSFSSRILDLGYISSACCLGLIGVKVGTIL